MEMTREQLNARRAVSRCNAQIREKNVRKSELHRSGNDFANACSSTGHAIKELLSAIFAVIKFVARDVWAFIGKCIQLIARKMNKAGNRMDWGDK